MTANEKLRVDMLQQHGIVKRAYGTRAAPRRRCHLLPVPVHRCSGYPPAPGDPCQAIAASHGGRNRLAHRLDRRRAKGEREAHRSVIHSSSSLVRL
jgi:hypothetical protein